MHLPGDHTAAGKPNMPTPRACMADNDLALGRIVEALSHSRFWKDSVVFVVEDDPQAGPDHIDSHRSVLLTISPYNCSGTSVCEHDGCARRDRGHTRLESVITIRLLQSIVSRHFQQQARSDTLRDTETSAVPRRKESAKRTRFHRVRQFRF
jgi:hypothetical protein